MKKTKVLIQLSICVVLLIFLTNCKSGQMSEYSKATIVQTSKAGDKLADKGTFNLSETAEANSEIIKLNPEQKFQEIAGIGGAFTGSSASVLNQLSKEKRDEVILAYFAPEGAAYSLMRAQIGGSDFSVYSYSFAETPGDMELKDFSIKEDEKELLPLIKDAQKISKDGFNILGSPWTAPRWMKDNNAWYGGSLKTECYPTWALYLSKYIKAYEKEGIPIWGITPENEPVGNGGQWDSMIFTPEQMRDFIKNHLGPQFEKDKINSKILCFDQNRDEVSKWAETILSDKNAAKYIWGTAVHWYASTTSWFPEVLDSVHNKFPDKQIMHTEACVDNDVPVWKNDEWYWSKLATDWGYEWAAEKDKHLHPMYVPVSRYANDIIGGINSWLTGWIDWNIVLDDKGGPNHAKNWAVAPVLVKPETGEIYYTPLFYVLNHFSKYIRPGAHRIGVECSTKNLMVTACLNKDKKIAVEVYNSTENAINYSIQLGGKNIKTVIPRNAIQTIVIQ
jgi:glucosylceramidase